MIMEKLPWFIRQEIIDYVVTSRKEYCLVNKEWFNYAAGRFMVLKNRMICKDRRPSQRHKQAEKLQLHTFSSFNTDFLEECKKIKQVDFMFTEEIKKIPFFYSYLFREMPIESANIHLNYLIHENYQYLIEEFSDKLKYLFLDLNLKTKITDEFFKLPFSNLVAFEANNCLSPVVFSKIHQFMPKLESLKFQVDLIEFQFSSTYIPTFTRLKKLSIKFYNKQTNHVNKLKGIFQFYFPVLLIFQLENFSEKIDHANLAKCMPKLQNLQLDLISHKVLSPNFPSIIFPHLLKLHLNFNIRAKNLFNLNLKYLPELRHLFINDDFVFCDPKKESCPKVNKLECYAINNFPHSSTIKHLSNLTTLIIDCNSLWSNLQSVLQLCDRVINLTLLNLNYKVPTEALPIGPFKTICLKLTGHTFQSNEFVNWFASQFQLTNLTLEYNSYENLHIDHNKFSSLQHFYLKRYSDNPKKYNTYEVEEQYVYDDYVSIGDFVAHVEREDLVYRDYGHDIDAYHDDYYGGF